MGVLGMTPPAASKEVARTENAVEDMASRDPIRKTEKKLRWLMYVIICGGSAVALLLLAAGNYREWRLGIFSRIFFSVFAVGMLGASVMLFGLLAKEERNRSEHSEVVRNLLRW